MFSLIVTIIAIALVAALAVATIYYGGSAYTQGTVKSNAAALVNQATQIKAANLFYANEHGGSFAPTIEALTGTYLKSIPAPSPSASTLPYSLGATDSVVQLIMDGAQASALCDELVANKYDCSKVDGTATFKVNFATVEVAAVTNDNTLWGSIAAVRTEALAFIATSPGAIINSPDLKYSYPQYTGLTDLAIPTPTLWPDYSYVSTSFGYSGTGAPTSYTELLVSGLTVSQCSAAAVAGGLPVLTSSYFSGATAACYIAPLQVGAFMDDNLMPGWTLSTQQEVLALLAAGAINQGQLAFDADPSTIYAKRTPSATDNSFYMQIDSHQLP